MGVGGGRAGGGAQGGIHLVPKKARVISLNLTAEGGRNSAPKRHYLPGHLRRRGRESVRPSPSPLSSLSRW